MIRNMSIASALLVAVLVAPLEAQQRGKTDRQDRSKATEDRTERKNNWGQSLDDIPPGHRPPPGMCRVWIDGVPAGHQPAPTDCATAVRNRPSNGRVVYGDDYRHPGKSGDAKARKVDRRGGDDDRTGTSLPPIIRGDTSEKAKRDAERARKRDSVRRRDTSKIR